MNKPATIAFVPGHAPFAPSVATHTRALVDLVSGEARSSLLAIHDLLRRALPPGKLATYEAGGGSTSFLPLDVLRRSHVTVVDIDEDQVRNNNYAHEAIVGDIQTYRFKPESFDLVICYNVIEHLSDVEAALTNFREALKPGGLILIGAPNPHSLSGVITKYSPHWFHVWYYRHIRGIRNAGQPGEPPFPTLFHPLVTLSNLEAFADAHGLETIYRREVESPRYPEMRDRKPLLAGLVDAFANVVNAMLSHGTDIRRGDYHIILRKR